MDSPQKQVAVRVNDFQFLLAPDDLAKTDFIRISDHSFHLIKDSRSVKVTLLDADASAKKLRMEVEGDTFDVEIKDELAQMLDQLGFSAVSTRQIKEIKAPMPGLVLDIHVEAGQEVVEGDKILILEAMKMENSLLIHTNARIKTVLVKKGQAVDKNQVLIELE
jgi:biotin carboxyl carrier protein